MKKFKVALSYPTAITIKKKTYFLYPGKEVELPEDEKIVKTYLALGYLKPVEEPAQTSTDTKPENVAEGFTPSQNVKNRAQTLTDAQSEEKKDKKGGK